MKIKDLNVADWISIYRITAVPVLVLIIIAGNKLLFAWLLLLSLSTDIIDGMIARWLKISTKRGAQLDSIGDALTFAVAIAGAWRFGYDFFRIHYKLVLLAVVPYVIELIIAFIVYGKPSSFHTYLAKAATILQGIFLLTLFFFEPVMWLFYPAAIVTALELIEEIILVFILKGWQTDVKGLYWVLKKKRGR